MMQYLFEYHNEV